MRNTLKIVDFNLENCSRVRIYFENFLVTYIEESPVISKTSLISNLGGILGLFIGISILSFVEIFDLFLKFSFRNLQRFKISALRKAIIQVKEQE